MGNNGSFALNFQDPNDPLNSVPIKLTREEELIFALADPDVDNQVISARVPIPWVRLIDRLREMPNGPFPNGFPTRQDFMRWCVYLGLMQFRQWVDDGGHTESPDIAAHIFSERVVGKLSARSGIIKRIRLGIKEISEGVRMLMESEEYSEAADTLNEYIMESAKMNDPFWRSYLFRELYRDANLAASIDILIAKGLFVNAVVGADSEPLSNDDNAEEFMGEMFPFLGPVEVAPDVKPSSNGRKPARRENPSAAGH